MDELCTCCLNLPNICVWNKEILSTVDPHGLGGHRLLLWLTRVYYNITFGALCVDWDLGFASLTIGNSP